MRKEKSIVLAYVIWMFLGQLAVHRFYLGRVRSGLIMLAMPITMLVLLAVIGATAESGTISEGFAVGLSIVSVSLAGVWVFWLFLDLILIPVMITKDRRKARELDEGTVRRVFE